METMVGKIIHILNLAGFEQFVFIKSVVKIHDKHSWLEYTNFLKISCINVAVYS